MFGSDEGGRSLSDVAESVRARVGRDPDETCDVCGETEGSMIHLREYEVHVCSDCYNDPETYEELDDSWENPYED